MLELEPATTKLAELVRSVPESDLPAPTPIGTTVGELLDHVRTFSHAFALAAAKVDDEILRAPAPTPDAGQLGDDWRERLPRQLDELASAWREPAAWEGMTKIGGLDMPGEVVGVIALDEVVLHSWDLAVATGQAYDPPARLLEPLVPFLQHVSEPGMEAARQGLFGPVVPVPDDAPMFDRILGMAGRHPDTNTKAKRR